jgi:hypothetical protein
MVTGRGGGVYHSRYSAPRYPWAMAHQRVAGALYPGRAPR